MLSRHGSHSRQRAWTSARSGGAPHPRGALPARRLVRLAAELPHGRGRRKASSTRCATTSTRSSAGCRCSTSTSHARGDILSRVTNDIDNIAADAAADAHADHYRRAHPDGRAGDDVLDQPAARVHRPAHRPDVDLRDHADREAFAEAVRRCSGQRTGTLNGHVEETFTGHNIVKVFGARRRPSSEFDEENEQLYQASFKAQFISGIIMPSMMFIGNLQLRGHRHRGRVARGERHDVARRRQAFIQYSQQFTQPITQTASVANVLQSAVASAERVFELLDEAEQSAGRGSAAVLTHGAGPHRVRGRLVPLPARRAAHRGPQPRGAARPDGRDRGPHRRRQDHAGQPAHALLRDRRGGHPASTASTRAT